MTTTSKPTTVRLERTITAPPHEVYRAWLDPEVLRRWLAAGAMAATRVDVDERVGGRFAVWQVEADGSDAGGMEAEIEELAEDARLVFRWAFVGPERTDGPTFDTRLTVTFDETAEGATLLTLVHERLDSLLEAMPEVAEQVGAGWNAVLEKLAATVGS